MALRRCQAPGCTELVKGTYCAVHAALNMARRRAEGDTGSRGTSGEWRRVRARALIRDAFTCQECGRHEQDVKLAGGHLEVHHVNGDANDNRLDNLTTLCAGKGKGWCHNATFKRTP